MRDPSSDRPSVHRSEIAAVAGLLAAALAARLALAAVSTNRVDLNYYESWARAVTLDGIGQGYVSGQVDYPPGYLYLLWPIGWIYRRFFSPEFELNTPALHFLLRLVPIPFDLGATVVIFGVLRRRFPTRTALLPAALYAFNPGILHVTAWWGQTDSIYTLLALLAVLALEGKRWGAAWAFSAAGALFKHQYIFILPLVVGVTLARGGWRAIGRGMLSGSAIAFLLMLPFIGDSERMMAVVRMYAGYGSYTPFFAVNAFNPWYLLTLGQGQWSGATLDTQPLLLGVSFREASLLAFGAILAWVTWQAVTGRTGSSLAFPAAVSAMTLFIVPTQVHERYLFPVFAFLSLLYLEWPDLRVHYGLLSATYFWNVATVLDSSWALGKTWLGAFNLAAAMINGLLFLILLAFCTGKRSLAEILGRRKHAPGRDRSGGEAT